MGGSLCKMYLRRPLAPDDRHSNHGREMGIAMSICSSVSAHPVYLFSDASSKIGRLVRLAEVGSYS